MKSTSRGMHRQTTIERVCRETTVPYYSTKQVRRVANMILGKNVSGEEASAILLALIVGPGDPCAFASDPTEFGHGPSAWRSSTEDTLLPARSENGRAVCDMRHSPRRHAAHLTCERREPENDIRAIAKIALDVQPGMRDLPSWSCPARAPNPRRNLRSGRLSGSIIPIVKSGFSNSVNSRSRMSEMRSDPSSSRAQSRRHAIFFARRHNLPFRNDAMGVQSGTETHHLFRKRKEIK